MRGSAALIVIAVLALIGGGLFVTKPKFMHGDSKRAAASTATTQALVDASTIRGAFAAASIVKIGEANAQAPDSPEKAFIAREVPVALANLPAPDQTALIEAERRKVAVLSGKLDVITPLYEKALVKAADNARELTKALIAKRKSDLELEQVASERLGAERVKNWAIAVAVVAVCLYLYVKMTHVGPGAIAELATDLKRTAPEAVAHLDSITSRLTQLMARTIAKFKS